MTNPIQGSLYEPEQLRLVGGAESALIFSFLTIAARMEDSSEPIQKALVDVHLAKYWRGWGREGDLGVVAIRPVDGVPVCCAWVRRFSKEEAGETFVDERTPELAVATVAGERGRGLGTRVLVRLLELSGSEPGGISLSVRAANPAVGLYQRLGFATVAEVTNRVGSKSFTMLRRG